MQLRKVVNHGNIRWRVTTRLNGKRKQRFFESREGARGWIKLLNADEASGGFWGQRIVAERDEIINAFNASRERQVPLLEAILDWQPLVPAKPDKHRLVPAKNFVDSSFTLLTLWRNQVMIPRSVLSNGSF